MNNEPLLSALARRPLCGDGAMGTQLLARGLSGGACPVEWNVQRPDAIREVHERFRDAGCDLMTTNTFGGSGYVLASHGLEDRVGELNEAGAQIARSVAGAGGWVLGDIGPFGDFLEPVGEMTADRLKTIFRAQIEALLAGNVDALLVETMSDPSEAVVAIEAAHACGTKVPIVVSYAFQKTGSGDFRTMTGCTVEHAMKAALEAGADVVGTNCGVSLSLDDYIALAGKIMVVAGDAPVMVQPNAGSPRTEGEQTVYDATPEQMADAAETILALGVRIVGGCCGTTPAHLATISRVVRERSAF